MVLSYSWVQSTSSDDLTTSLLMHLMKTLPLVFGSDVLLESCCFGPLVRSRLTWSLKLRPTDLSISFCCPCDEEIKLNTLFQVKWGTVATLTQVSLSRSSTCPFPPYILLINLVVVSWAITPLFNEMSCMWGFIVQLEEVSHK